jgi:hypothetical protein
MSSWTLPSSPADRETGIARLTREYVQADALPTIATVRAWQAALSDGDWFACCDAFPLYQVWTQESVAALAAVCRQAGSHRILEVGAGDGRLTRALRPQGPWTMVASDDGSWRTALAARSPTTLDTPVIPLAIESLTASLARVQPDTVIVSWMPYAEDWSPAFRARPTVQHYLWIGEGPGGCTGTETLWDVPDGWTITEVPDFAAGAACRTDGPGFRSSAWIASRSPLSP